MTEQDELPLASAEQWRATRLELLDWGTFSGIHAIHLSREGHLIAGPSGSGKSTILDAFSALLIPKRFIDFNAAAREQEKRGKDRNFASYVRGAWKVSQDDATGETAIQFLRQGSTWSALALRFENGQGHVVTLAQLLWIAGNGSADSDVKRLFLIFRKPIDLSDFSGFDLNVRKFKSAFSGEYCESEFGPYQERYTKLLGIESEEALKLLHKTQSAKNLGDLNVFLRDFMLDKPDTFDACDDLVREFSELKAAHEEVVDARRQIEILEPARLALSEARKAAEAQERISQALNGLDIWTERRREELLVERVEALELNAAGLMTRSEDAARTVENEEARLDDLKRQVWDGGGKRLEELEAQLRSVEVRRETAIRKRTEAEAACRVLGRSLPADPENFGRLIQECNLEVDAFKSGDGNHGSLSLERDELAARRRSLLQELNEVRGEIKSLESRRSNIPREYIELRQSICSMVGENESAFPFVGELMQVKDQEYSWAGAAERTLRGFALSLLVDEKRYPRFERAVNEQHWGMRVVYYRVAEPNREQVLEPGSLVSKLDLKDGQWKRWLHAELSRRFNYRCAETGSEFQLAERAITKAGQIKHDRQRHEKDDRYRVDDRTRWVLGFDNYTKLALYREQREGLEREETEVGKGLERLVRELQDIAVRAVNCGKIVGLRWEEVDAQPLIHQAAALQKEIHAAKLGGSALQKIIAARDAQQKATDLAKAKAIQAANDAAVAKSELESTRAVFRSCAEKFSGIGLTPLQREDLDALIREIGSPTLESLDGKRSQAQTKLSERQHEFLKARMKQESAAVAAFKEFDSQWHNGDQVPSLEYADDFMGKLDRLITDGLPRFEDRFFKLLKDQSYKRIAALFNKMETGRRDIERRMIVVNESLSKSPFGVGTWLRIATRDRVSEDVRTFKSDLRELMSNALLEDKTEAEQRFERVRDLVARLSAQTDADERWKRQVLDIRLHVEFDAQEYDDSGKVIEVYQSGSGKSGGQRQKLATACLAAALRYQLGGRSYGEPRFAMIVMDEAFDKADNEFTRQVMTIFKTCGFQMIMATPMKAVMSLEPFIGGACYLGIKDRNDSGTLALEYDEVNKRVLTRGLPAGREDDPA